MNYKIKVYRHFEKEVKKLSKRYKSLKQDLTILAAELMQNPDMGTDLGNGLHKVRMSIASKGKGKGKIEIEYYSDDELEHLFDMMMSIKRGE